VNAAAGCIKDATWSKLLYNRFVAIYLLLIADKVANTALCVVNIVSCYYQNSSSGSGGGNGSGSSSLKRSVLVSSFQVC
jgi:hypothetical protein